MRAARATRFLLTLAGSVVVTGAAFYAVDTWAGLYMPWKGSLAVASLVALGLPWILNKFLTRSYRKVDASAKEWNSIFGMALATHLVLLPALYLGVGGPAGRIAVAEAAREAAVQAGVWDPVQEATLDSFPLSEVDTGIIWVPNVASPERPMVVVRAEGGDLKAIYLPEMGEKIEAFERSFIVGPAERNLSRVMLCPIPPKNPLAVRNRSVRVHFEGGVATFHMLRDDFQMGISSR